ncbi:class II fructose-bisphosphate aldolase [Candidatus Wolfebacteria bacterium]|nr:class II fructose-bisphosphate aldolase [Candidatus Wolfebacteria bacterium]
MLTLQEVFRDVGGGKVALGHFNIANIEMFWGVVRAARSLDVPVVIGVSEDERDFIGIAQIGALVASIRAEGTPVFLNADHSYSFERVKEAIDSNVFDSVIFDGAALPYDENLAITKQCIAYAREHAPDILIEAELGFIGKGSTIIDAPPAGAVVTEEQMTKPEEAAAFVGETGVDLFAPAVGNVHGMVKGGEPRLSSERVRSIKEAVGIPLVLHGASGNTDEDIRAVIEAGIAQVHISTELRVAYRDALKQTLIGHPDELAPYRLLKPVVQSVQETVENKLRLFNNL